jgi:hypothetical protein
MNADPPKILIIVQLMNSPQVWKSSIKATSGVSTSTDVLIPVTLSPPSASLAMEILDPPSPGPSASL